MSSAGSNQEHDSAEIERLRSALAREERISRGLREVSVALGATLELDDLLELILSRITELLDADRSTLYLLDEGGQDLLSRVVVGFAVRSVRVKVGHGIAGIVAQTGKPIRVADAYKDPRFEAEWDLLTGYRTTCMLAAPLRNNQGRTIGVISVLNKSTGEFTDEDEAILAALSMQAAIAIDNSRLFLSVMQKNRQLLEATEQLERKVQHLELLFELEHSTSRAESLEELISAGLLTLARSCNARGAALLLSRDDSGDLVQYVYDADKPGRLARQGVKYGEGFLGEAMASGTVLRSSGDELIERFGENIQSRYALPVESVLAVALGGESLAGEQRSLGAIALITKRDAPRFEPDDEALLQLVGANVSTALRLYLANDERERSARLTSIGRLLSQVIHDFKTPFTVISGHVQLMQNENDPERRREHAQKVLKQFDVLSLMQQEVLEFARGERTIFIRRVYLHKFFSEFRQQLSYELDGRAIDLVLDVDNKIVARFDENRVARALHNLARNAIEAMADKGGELRVEARMDGDELLIAVSDTGPGISDEIKDRLFQSFVTSGKKAGTGLGLAIVRKIVDEHGGRILTTSTSKGARFEMRLPQTVVAPRSRRPEVLVSASQQADGPGLDPT